MMLLQWKTTKSKNPRCHTRCKAQKSPAELDFLLCDCWPWGSGGYSLLLDLLGFSVSLLRRFWVTNALVKTLLALSSIRITGKLCSFNGAWCGMWICPHSCGRPRRKALGKATHRSLAVAAVIGPDGGVLNNWREDRAPTCTELKTVLYSPRFSGELP